MGVIVIGADIGQKIDPTALVVCEYQRVEIAPSGIPVDETGLRDLLNIATGVEAPPLYDTRYVVRAMERLPLGTPYPAVARRLNGVAAHMRLRDSKAEVYLVVDATGVGGPVIDILRAELAEDVHMTAATITGGMRCDSSPLQRENISMAKAWMVSRLQAILQTRRLVMPKTREAKEIADELVDFELKVSQDGATTFDAKLKHDDYVTALGLAVLGEAHSQVTYGPRLWG